MKMSIIALIFSTVFLLAGCGKEESSSTSSALPMNGQSAQLDGVLRIPKQGMTGIQPSFVYAGQNFSFAQNTSQQVIQTIYQLYYSSGSIGSGTYNPYNGYGYQMVENNSSYTAYRARISGSVIQAQPMNMQMQNVNMGQPLIQAMSMMPY
jgi:hypothetical protein